MSTTRKLLPTDWRSMGRLRATCSTHAGGQVSEFSTTPLISVSNRYQYEPNFVAGHFDDDDVLTAYICGYSSGEDFWVLDLMISSGNPKDLHNCLDLCLEHYEANGISKFYYAFPEKWARAYRSFWRNGVDRLKKYTIEDLAIIEARKKPGPWIWEHIMHEYIAPVSLLLRKSYVKPTR